MLLISTAKNLIRFLELLRRMTKETFSVTLNGKTVTIALDEARAKCPDKVRVMEQAWRTNAPAEVIYQAMADLLHALAESQRRS